MQISLETIYELLYVRAKNNIYHSVYKHLRRKWPMRYSRYHENNGDSGAINNVQGVSIHERSKHIDNRRSFGH